MSYQYRQDSSEDSEDDDSASASASTSNPHFDPISSGDSHSEASSPSPSNDDDYSQYLKGPGSQSASYVSRLAGKCNVTQLKKILSQYGVMGLSKARKPSLIKKAVECHNGLDEATKKRFQASLADPSGKEPTVTSTVDDHSPERIGRSSRSAAAWNRPRRTIRTPSPEYSMEEDDDYVEEEIPLPRRRATVNIPPSRYLASDSESSTSPELPSRPEGQARARILLKIPTIKSSAPVTEAPPVSVTTSVLRNPPHTTSRYDNPSQPSMAPAVAVSKSPIRPYVPAGGGFGMRRGQSTTTPWPPPLPVDTQRKRTNDHFSGGGEGSNGLGGVITAKRLVLNAQPTMQQQQVAAPSPYIPTSSHAQSAYSFFPGQSNGGYPLFAQLSQSTPGAASSTGSSGTNSLLARTASGGQRPYSQSFSNSSGPYPPLSYTQNGGSAAAATAAQDSAEYNARITHLMRSLSDDPGMSPHTLPVPPLQPRRDFQAASTLNPQDPRLRAYSNGMAIQQRHSVIHPYQGQTSTAELAAASQRAALVSQAAAAAVRNAQQTSCGGPPGGGSSIMSNNPFAQAFTNGHAHPAGKPTASEDPESSTKNKTNPDSKVLRFKVDWPSVPSEEPPGGHGGRVIKAPVFHETLWQVREPLSIRRDQTLTTRGVYREIIMTFYFNQSSVNVNDPNTVVLFRFCQESASLTTAYEMHPDNLKLMLNGKTLVEPAVVDFSNRMKKKKNAVFNQPIEVSLAHLCQQNVVLVRWTEDGAQTGQPAPSVPDEPPKDYYLIVECAKRKTMEAILQTVNANRVPVKDTVYKLYQTLGGGDDDIVTDSQKISLHCPASRSRLSIPVRGRNCDHIDCFDVSSFLYMNKSQKARWTCPKCNKSVQFDEIVVDEFMQSLLSTFPTSEGIDATLENKEIVVREAKKPQKSESSRNVVETVSGRNSSSSSSSTATPASSLVVASKQAPPANKPPPDVITLD